MTVVCRHMRNEARDETISRLRKQKGAAHARNYRLGRKIRKLELTNRLLTAVYLVSEKCNAEMRKQITEFMKNAKEDPMQPVRLVAQGDPA